MTIHIVDDYLTISADWAQASSPIEYRYDNGGPGEAQWEPTVFQVADCGHDRGKAGRMVDEWLDSQSG
jgi:hypothetical protein